jgi:hypothetical protein
MGLLSRVLHTLFGCNGRVRFEGVTVAGQTFSGSSELRCFGVDVEEIEERLKTEMFIKYGKPIRELRIVALVKDEG